MLPSGSLIGFVPSTDLVRAREFYEHTLGLRLVEHNEYACVFDANGTMLRVTAVGELAARGYTVLGWQVTDINRTIEMLVSQGVQFTRYDGMGQDDTGVWTTPGGDRVAWFRDPDGNTLSLTQFATNAPQQAGSST